MGDDRASNILRGDTNRPKNRAGLSWELTMKVSRYTGAICAGIVIGFAIGQHQVCDQVAKSPLISQEFNVGPTISDKFGRSRRPEGT